MANRLVSERSPYLRQHAENPVDWFPWGEEAFDKARREGKPIFLSVGYATCHWCHVMERESFENTAVAAQLNADFVSIKVDREERPDVDRVYMLFVQATTGAGGWPMSVWLTPALKPFFGGTYFPPESRWGRPGFRELLSEIARTWRQEPARVHEAADHLLERLTEATRRASQAESHAEGNRLDTAGALRMFEHVFDARHGGFGEAPKFPRPVELFFLLRLWSVEGVPAARDMVLETLRAMALGGVRDHIGGGFHRYAVDAAWRVPHFEKMLYDQAQLVMAFVEAWQASGDEFYLTVAEDTVDYVLRDLTHPAGGFFSAEDADSVPSDQDGEAHGHKMEGAFYLWTTQEVEQLLGAEASIVSQRFGFEANGNAPHDPQGEFRGKNIPYIARPIDVIATREGRSEVDVMTALAAARPHLHEARAGRPRPERDEKVLTAWNGLMIAALARLARAEPVTAPHAASQAARALAAATRAAAFVRAELWDEGAQRLGRSFLGSRAPIEGFCEDYACMVWGLLELFQASARVEWLAWAVQLADVQDALFWDDEAGGWYSTTGQDPHVLLRLKEDYDGAEPSGGSIATMNALVLAHLTGRDVYRERARRALSRVSAHQGQLARAMPYLLSAQLVSEYGLGQVVVATSEEDDGRALFDTIARHASPFVVTIRVTADNRAALGTVLPSLDALTARGGKATAYLCRDFVCHEPTSDAQALARQLTGR